MIKLRLWIWGMKTTEINYYSYCSFSVVPVINMTSHYQGYSCSAGWGSICQVLHFKITLFSPFSYYLLWKSLCVSHPYGAMFLEGGEPTKLFEIFYIGDLSILCYLLIDSTSYLYQNGLSYLVYTLNYNLILLSLFTLIVVTLAIGNSFSWLLFPFNTPLNIVVICVLKFFLLFWHSQVAQTHLVYSQLQLRNHSFL